MPEEKDRQNVFSIITVPAAHADKVRAFAASLAEAERPDVEGYGMLRGIGTSGGSKVGSSGILAGEGTTTGVDCAFTSSPSGATDADCAFID